MLSKTVSQRSKLYGGFAAIAALALFTACDANEPTQEDPVDPGVEQEDPMQDDPMQDDPADDLGDEGNEVEGAGQNNATSLLGFTGSTHSWAL